MIGLLARDERDACARQIDTTQVDPASDTPRIERIEGDDPGRGHVDIVTSLQPRQQHAGRACPKRDILARYERRTRDSSARANGQASAGGLLADRRDAGGIQHDVARRRAARRDGQIAYATGIGQQHVCADMARILTRDEGDRRTGQVDPPSIDIRAWNRCVEGRQRDSSG